METELIDMVEKINQALRCAGYKSSEATAKFWSKEIKPGQIIQRIYLSGKKAGGYIASEDGRLVQHDVRAQMLFHTLEGIGISK